MKLQAFLILLAVALLAACSGGDGKQPGSSAADTAQVRIETLNAEIGKNPSNPVLYNRRARFYLHNQEFDKALSDIHKAISIDGRVSTYYITLSDIYLMMGKLEDCRDALRKAVSMNGKDTDALMKLAKLYLIVKDYKSCYETVKQLLTTDPSNATGYFTRAIALLEQGDTLRAVDDLRHAVDINQSYYEAFVQLGELYSIKKDPLAELYLKNALTLRPGSREALYMLGMYYQDNAKYEQALRTYQFLEKSDTSFRDASYNQGYIYLVYLKDFPKAAQKFADAIRKDPGYYEAYFNRGYAFELAGDYKKAYEDYQKALKIKVNYDKAIEGLNRLDKVTRGK